MKNQQKQTIIVTFFSTLLQWLEYASYGYLASIIAVLFFPEKAPLAVMIGSATLILSKYLTRPIGALIFGYIGDQYGRKSALFYSILTMGIASIVICLLPTYAQIGLLAPIILMLCRLAQGLAIAGEMNGAMIYLTEQSNKRFPHLASCWAGMATGLGILFGGLFADGVGRDILMNWGWRVPFMFGSVLCIVCTLFIANTRESTTFVQATFAERRKHQSILKTLINLKSNLLIALITSAFVIIYLNICASYYHAILISQFQFTIRQSMWLVSAGAITLIALLPIMAYAADVIGGRNIIIAGLMGSGMVAPLMFALAPTHSFFMLGFMQLFFAVFGACVCAPLFRMQMQLFPTRIRYTALSIAWSISLSVFGTTSEAVIQLLSRHLHETYAPALYVSISAAIALIAILTASTTQKIEPELTFAKIRS